MHRDQRERDVDGGVDHLLQQRVLEHVVKEDLVGAEGGWCLPSPPTSSHPIRARASVSGRGLGLDKRAVDMWLCVFERVRERLRA